MQLAVAYYQQGLHQVALEEVAKVLLASPELADAYGLRALISWIRVKMVWQKKFLRALSLAPNSSDVANNYGWFLCQTGREAKGMLWLDRAIKDNTYQSLDMALNNAGLCSLRLKNTLQAEKYFRSGFREQPGNSAISVNLSKLLYEKSEYSEAKFYIDRLIKAEVMSPEVLWMAIKIETKLADHQAVTSLATQLRRRHPASKEYGLFQRGAFNE